VARKRSRKAKALTLVIEVPSRVDANSKDGATLSRASGTVINVQYALPLIPTGRRCAGWRVNCSV